ncbi:TetR/AcrR family transcriptional regulator [Streptomyces sp. NPDC048603]|uniref:TetR/AcrR family transcriptional regulator n=1 Tax=Streptomyces sp. NPDC048603 TaxID=3365577 RepID=UPI00371BA388
MTESAESEPETGTGLPASLEMAWGLRVRPSKGPRPALTLDRIVAAAVGLAAAEGVDAVSMGRVAKELGASTMSLYRYVAAKDELYVLMADAGVGTPPPLPDTAGAWSWRELLAEWAHAQRRVLMAAPWVLRIPITGPPATPNQVAWMERGLAAMAGTGMPEKAKLSTLILIGGFVRNQATLTADMIEAIVRNGLSPDQVIGHYRSTLRLLTDPTRHPAVTRLLDSGLLDGGGGTEAEDPDYEFRFGLDRILDGLEALMGQGRAETGADREG